MNKYAQAILWMGLFMILAQIMTHWSTYSAAIFGGGSDSGITGASGSGVNIAGGISPNPKTGKCPPGYNSAFGKCWSPATNPIPPTSGGSA